MERSLLDMLPEKWRNILKNPLLEKNLANISAFLEEEKRKGFEIYPAHKDLFSAFRYTEPEKVKVLLLGQDPYHEPRQAHGLAFSVPPGVKKPPSLQNIFKEYEKDTALQAPEDGSLIPWAEEGVLLLNTVLTVRAHEANSHKEAGWEVFTDSVIKAVDSFPRHIVFILWGKPAQKKLSLIDRTRHTVIISAHPSPLSAYRGFFGSRPFSCCNEALLLHGQERINWDLAKK